MFIHSYINNLDIFLSCEFCIEFFFILVKLFDFGIFGGEEFQAVSSTALVLIRFDSIFVCDRIFVWNSLRKLLDE